MIINNKHVSGIPYLKPAGAKPEKRNVNQAADFAGILQKKLIDDREVKISKHARHRMETRNLNLSDNQRIRLPRPIKVSTALTFMPRPICIGFVPPLPVFGSGAPAPDIVWANISANVVRLAL